MVSVQGTFPWYEEVRPPGDPRKTVHVVNHWRKPPRLAVIEPSKDDDPGLRPQVVVRSSSLRV